MAITPTRKLAGPGLAQQLENVNTLAATGSTQADAAPIKTKSPAIIYVTGANATVGVLLPKAVRGKSYTIVNRDSDNAVLKVYPFEATGVINALSAGAAISMAAKTRALFKCVIGAEGTPTWVTIPLVPS